jgi:hypothetical protein
MHDVWGASLKELAEFEQGSDIGYWTYRTNHVWREGDCYVRISVGECPGRKEISFTSGLFPGNELNVISELSEPYSRSQCVLLRTTNDHAGDHVIDLHELSAPERVIATGLQCMRGRE